VACRWRAQCRHERSTGLNTDRPRYLENLPLFFDHSWLDYLNSKAVALNLDKPFDSVHQIGKNNGEVFLSRYHKEQQARNNNLPAVSHPGLCQCVSCLPFDRSNMTLERSDLEDHLEAPLFSVGDDEIVSFDEPRSSPKEQQTSQQVNNLPIPQEPPSLGVAHVNLWGWNDPYWCSTNPPCHCPVYQDYVLRKNRGDKLLGRPPHSYFCPKTWLCPATTG